MGRHVAQFLVSNQFMKVSAMRSDLIEAPFPNYPNSVREAFHVLVVDDHPIWREGVIRILQEDQRAVVVGESGNGAEALSLALELIPDVILLDVNLPQLNGLQIASRLKEMRLHIKIILVTAYDDHLQAIHAIQAGCHAYFGKDVTASDLLRAIDLVINHHAYIIRGEVYDEDGVTDWLTQQLSEQPYLLIPQGQAGILSPREMEILERLADGQTNHFIAQDLAISYQTVKNHVSSVLAKLGVEDRFQAALFAIRHGWVRPHNNTGRVNQVRKLD
jgi:DNA-binding NarL/FixJ family response regulator